MKFFIFEKSSLKFLAFSIFIYGEFSGDILLIKSYLNFRSFFKLEFNISINRFNKNLGIKDNSVTQNVYDKMMNQFIFKKNAERQRKIRIDDCLNYKKDEEENELIFTGKSHKNKKIQRMKFYSIIDSGLITKLLKNCRKDAKNKINTERINNKIDGEFGEEGEILKNSKRKVIKLNF